jgi:hypothetical protein
MGRSRFYATTADNANQEEGQDIPGGGQAAG